MNFLDTVPSFINGVHAVHDELIGVAIVLVFAGILIHCFHALASKNISAVIPTLVRLAFIPLIILGLETWGDLLVDSVSGLITDIGGNGNGANIFQDYQAAIARKMGTAAAAQNVNQQPQQPGFLAEGDTSGGFAQPALNGVTLTDYAYPSDSTPDGNSSRGIGAFGFSSAPGSLIPNYSAALSDDVAKQYNLSPGQSFTVNSTNGKTYNLVYADRVTLENGRIDIYSPDGSLGGNNFSESVAGINGGPVVMGQTGLASMMPNPGGSIGDQVMWAITLALSWAASGLMWLMTIAQKLLYLIEMSVSPVFIGCLMIPALTHLARRFFMVLVGICLWPLGWAICNLVTKFLIDLAVNPAGNTGLRVANTASLVSGPLAGLAYLLVVAVWVIGSTIAAPVFIGVMLGIGGGTATGAVFGATLGAAAAMGVGTATRMVGGAGGAAAIVGGIGSGSAPAMSGMRMSAPRFSKRPIEDEL